MACKLLSIVLLIVAALALVNAGVVPFAPAAYVANYATSYNAHVVNHAVAAPIATAPIVAAAAPAPLTYAAYPYAAQYVL